MPSAKRFPAPRSRSAGGGGGRHRLLLGLLPIALVIAGCAGGGLSTPVPGTDPPPPASDPEASVDPDRFDVTIYTVSGPLYVEKLEVEFNQRRGIHEFYGFYPDAYDRMERIPFSELTRVDFQGPVPRGAFDQIILGREDQNLREEHGFELMLHFRDQTIEPFYAFIPRLRGERNFVLWEKSLNSNVKEFDYIEFAR